MIKKDFNTFLVSTKPKFKINRSPIPPWMNIAMAELGQAEIAGDEDNPRVVEYLKAVDLSLPDKRIDEISWCSAFVNWVMLQCDIEKTNKALAKSWLKWGLDIQEPTFGAVVVFDRGTEPWMGHVGFVVDVTPSYIYVLGGNQSNRVSVRPYLSKKLRGFKWPKL